MPKIDTGDTAWVLISTALVMLMTPALGFFYGGLVRRKNVLSTIMHSFFILGLISVNWVLWGYTLAFGPDTGRPHRRPRLAGARRRDRRADRRLRDDHPPPGLHGLPDDVRRHHAGPDHRRVRRAQALQGLRPVQRSPGRPSSTPRSPTGSGRPMAGCSTSARSTSPAAPSSISRAASRPWSPRWSSAAAPG